MECFSCAGFHDSPEDLETVRQLATMFSRLFISFCDSVIIIVHGIDLEGGDCICMYCAVSTNGGWGSSACKVRFCASAISSD